jgi:branched-subunit amino acid aminotransferase/4-amino-4-deoxychorismate lyase
MDVWLNGAFVDRDDARISAFDAGFQHGVGLFETMLARHGRVFRADEHVQRLGDSARVLGLSERLRLPPLVEAVGQTVSRAKLDQARVRLTVTGGDLNLLQSAGQTTHDPTILIVAQPPAAYPDAFFDEGVLVTIADGRLNPLDPTAGHKTLNYWPRLRELQSAAGKGAGEGLWFTVSNHLACACVGNVFLVKDNALLTPIARGEEAGGALPSPVLPGITRNAITQLAAESAIPTTKRMLTIEDVLGADEVFLTNSSWGVLPVRAVEREKIGDGKVGPMTRQLREAWIKCVEDETT